MDVVTVLSTEAATLNDTTEMPTKPPALYLAYNIIMMVVTGWIMFALGSGTKLAVVKERLKRPIGPVIGVTCQCFLFPALMYGYALALNIDDHISVGMVIAASTPGGAVSNMFTFWSKGDLDLSVTMTTISTALAIGFMPLNTYIYLRQWLNVSEIPFVDMVITILVVWGCVILGHIVGRIFPKAVPYVTKLGSVFGFILILITGAIQGALFPEVWSLDWTVWFAAITMPFFAFALGFLVSWIFCLDIKQRKAIAFEVSVQNIALAITVITVAFPNAEVASYYSQYVILYGTFQIVFGVAICILFTIYERYITKTTICHQYSRWKNRTEGDPDLRTVTTNGETLKEDDDNVVAKSESLTNMAYKGTSLSLTHMDADKTGSGFVPDGQTSSSTDLMRLDSVDSGIILSTNGILTMEGTNSGVSSANGQISTANESEQDGGLEMNKL